MNDNIEISDFLSNFILNISRCKSKYNICNVHLNNESFNKIKKTIEFNTIFSNETSPIKKFKGDFFIFGGRVVIDSTIDFGTVVLKPSIENFKCF